MTLPCHCHAIAMLLPLYCHAIAILLPCCRHAIAMLLPCYCCASAMLLPCQCHAIAIFSYYVATPLPCYCHASGMPLPCYGLVIAMLSPRDVHVRAIKLPSDWSTVRPIVPDEVRVVREGAMLDRALLVNLRTRQVKPILPDSALASQDALLAATQGINLLVLGLDQGSIGAAGYAYSDSMGALIHVKWDKFHRVIRDINLAVEHSCNGLFLKQKGPFWRPSFRGLYNAETSVSPRRNKLLVHKPQFRLNGMHTLKPTLGGP